MMFVSDLLSKFCCTYCQDEISGVLIKCVECKDLSLCLQCFAAGAEIGPHKNDHAYQFVDSDAQDLFKSKGGWSAREELLLLNGIEGYGFGNWKDIALKLEGRSAEECKEEYLRTFLDGSIGRLTWPEVERRPHKLHENASQTISKSPTRMAPIVITEEQAELLIYMPYRDDFEKEYNNNAENLISHLNISFTEDDELDVALKLAQVDMYMEHRRERKRRKRVARDYQLISKFFNSLYLRSKSGNPEQIDLEEKLKFLCQFLTCQEFESFVSSWLQQTSLRRRASELSRYRQAGLTRYEEIPHFEQESIYRSDTKPSLLLNPNTSPVLVGSSSTGTCYGLGQSGNGSTRSGSLSQSAPKSGLPPPSQALSPPPSPASSTAGPTTSAHSAKKKRKKRRNRFLFYRKKFHVPHRHPKIIAANRARAAALAAAQQALQIH